MSDTNLHYIPTLTPALPCLPTLLQPTQQSAVPSWCPLDLSAFDLCPDWYSVHPRISEICSEKNEAFNHTCIFKGSTVEPLYNEGLGTMKITLLYQFSCYIRVKKHRNIKNWDQQNDLVIRGFCYIRPLYNKVSLYTTHLQNIAGGLEKKLGNCNVKWQFDIASIMQRLIDTFIVFF